MKHSFLLSVVLALAACGGKSSATPAEPTPTSATPLAPGAWEGMDDHARGAFMKNTVLPLMASKFKAFDAEQFPDMDCKTCHGPGAAEGKFDMPSGALPELDFSAAPDPDDKLMHDFMEQEVKPAMAQLLGMTEWSPDNQTGFGCLGCHTMKQ